MLKNNRVKNGSPVRTRSKILVSKVWVELNLWGRNFGRSKYRKGRADAYLRVP